MFSVSPQPSTSGTSRPRRDSLNTDKEKKDKPSFDDLFEENFDLSDEEEFQDSGDEESQDNFDFQLTQAEYVDFLVPNKKLETKTADDDDDDDSSLEIEDIVWGDLYAELMDIKWEIRKVVIAIVVPNSGRAVHEITQGRVDIEKKEMVLGMKLLKEYDYDDYDDKALLCRSDLLCQAGIEEWDELLKNVMAEKNEPKRLIVMFLPYCKLCPLSSLRRSNAIDFSEYQTNSEDALGNSNEDTADEPSGSGSSGPIFSSGKYRFSQLEVIFEESDEDNK